jgi:hypothetical protein
VPADRAGHRHPQLRPNRRVPRRDRDPACAGNHAQDVASRPEADVTDVLRADGDEERNQDQAKGAARTACPGVRASVVGGRRINAVTIQVNAQTIGRSQSAPRQEYGRMVRSYQLRKGVQTLPAVI